MTREEVIQKIKNAANQKKVWEECVRRGCSVEEMRSQGVNVAKLVTC